MNLPFSNTAITIYNQYRYSDDNGKTQVRWIRHIVFGCFWGNQSTKVAMGDTIIDKNDTIVNIPEDAYFKEAWKWDGDDEYYTAVVNDVIVNGAVYDEIAPNGVISPILSKYADRAIIIKSVSNNTGANMQLGHISITGDRYGV